MAERLLKCPVCEQYGKKEDMIREEDKRYYHKEYCHDRWLKDREATRIENEQWDALYQYIIKLHDIIVLPKGNITRLKDLRAGYLMKNGQKVRQWRTGPDYGLMLEAYLLADDSIKWCIVNKLDGSKDTKAINYGISIMIDKLNEAFARRKRKKEHEKQIRKTTTQDKTIKQELKSKNTYINNDDMDISSFL
ncbi:hypothetical protein SAMN04487895_101554 [Paenibacillus sophorae]|uniref:Uncharacterized protein n=1 Tax=Paenibacillus sophorae TaxID=1333845 RepID=A0A1H8GKM1_9BACL|nr:hypothetical protein [Paenibacillus sophorae]QWU14260.1 hypothetical protein KP014_20340 [Paenibacillus sophorae]SEN44556.1 hypothetical protein SAMN04487895_101554 [Paenibacillus sophorae]